jgi:hypothetical protein
MKFESLTEKERESFLEPDNAYDIFLKKELYEYEWVAYKITKTHKWNGYRSWYTCERCGLKVPFKDVTVLPFRILNIDCCLTEDEVLIKDIIE